MEITYDYYRIFYYVAMYKSFSKAAKVLMSNQPNITHFMNNLENQLGCKLFVRSNRGVTLTAEGEKLYQHVSVAYQHLHAAEAELAMERSMESGSITISASEIALHLLLLPILGRFHKQYPGVRLRLLNHSTPEAGIRLIYTSLRESFGIPILEAMACGTPVITSTLPPCPKSQDRRVFWSIRSNRRKLLPPSFI